MVAIATVLAEGQQDEDTFVVNRNKCTLELDGGSGNENFVVNAFALYSQPGVYDQNPTSILAGQGTDAIQYADFFITKR